MQDAKITIQTADFPPSNERTVTAFDTTIDQWQEATYLPKEGVWIDSDGNNFFEGTISHWFDRPGNPNIEDIEFSNIKAVS